MDFTLFLDGNRMIIIRFIELTCPVKFSTEEIKYTSRSTRASLYLIVLVGSDGSNILLALSTPHTGKPVGSSKPICTKTHA